MGPLLFGCLDSLPVSSYRMADDDHRWQQQFREEKSSVVAVPCLPSDRVEHIGRTAVPGLGAKPLIDLMVGIPGPTRLDGKRQFLQQPQSFGYEYRGETVPGTPFIRWADPRRYDLHMTEYGGEFWVAHPLPSSHIWILGVDSRR